MGRGSERLCRILSALRALYSRASRRNDTLRLRERQRVQEGKGLGMRRRVWQGFMLMVIVAGVFAMGSAQAAAPYTDPQGRFSFTVPDGFAQQMVGAQAGNVAVFTSQTMQGAGFYVSAQNDPANAKSNLDDLTALTLQALSTRYPNIEIWSNGIIPAQVGGVEGRQYVYRAQSTGTNALFRGAIIVALKDSTAYTFAFSAGDGDFDRMADQATPVLATFAFTGMQPSAPGTGGVPNGPIVQPTAGPSPTPPGYAR